MAENNNERLSRRDKHSTENKLQKQMNNKGEQ